MSAPSVDHIALEQRAVGLVNQGRLREAEEIYRRIIAAGTNDHAVYGNLAAICGMQGRSDESMDLLSKALEINPGYPEACNNLGLALQGQGDLDAAIASYNKALVLRPNCPEFYNNLGIALQEQGDLDAAIASYGKALVLNPGYAEAHSNLGFALQERGDLTEAIASCQKALALRPGYPEAQSNLSIAELLTGDYSRGWERYECRFQKKNGQRILGSRPQCSRWNGDDLGANDELLLVSEQGLGDTLHFMRYALSLRQKGIQVSLCAPQKLHSLIRASGIDPTPLTLEQANAVTEGRWIPLLSVPRHLEVRPNNPIITEPYIKATGELVAKWRGILAGEQRPIIGLNWQGNPEHEKTNSQGRSLPLETFAPIAQHPIVSLLSLQKGFGSEQLETCSFKDRFVFCQQQVNETWDFLETAAIIANCDLVITSDTAVAHLAGGLGKTTWLLLKKVPEWRWGLEGDTTFWYPSMHLFRQKERGNWDEVLRRVAETLQKEFLAGAADGHGLPTQESKQQSSEPSAEQVCLEQQAIAFLHQGRHQEAEIIYRDIISSGTRNHVVYANLAAIYGEQGRFDEAVSLLDKALELNPNHPEARNNLGNVYKAQGDLDGAIASYKKALELRTSYPEAHNNLGNALKAQGNLEAAIESYKKAIELKKDYPEVYCNLGNALQEQGSLAAAIASYNKALALKWNYPEVHSNLGNVLKAQGDLPGAIASYGKALELKPHFPEAHNGLGNALAQHGDLSAAIDSYGKALKLKPYLSVAQSNLSMAELLIGHYEEGWERYEWRFQTKYGQGILCAQPRCAQWSGDDLGVSDELLLVSEQGLGDTLQFMRYALALRQKGIQVSLCAPQKLHSLIRASSIDPAPLTPEQANAVTEGRWIPLLSIPRHLEVSPGNPIITEPYINASDELVSKWQRILACEKQPVIGINWQGNPRHEKSNSQGRSLPLETFAPIAQNGNVSLLSLQKGFGSEQLETCSFKDRFVFCQQQVNETWDFLETAAIIANCDLVITSDTAVAHLAGGLGKTTWLLLKKVPEWRWGLEGDTTFWYPSMRLFRQKECGNWDEVLRRVAETLQTEFLARAGNGRGLSTQESKQHSSEPSVAQACLKQKGIALMHQGRHQEPEATYRDIISSGTHNHKICASLAAICGEQGRFDEAASLLDTALELNPNYPEALSNMGNAYKARGDLDAAIASYKQALGLRPNYPEVHNNLGTALKAQGNLEAAIVSYKKALELKPGFPEAHYNLGRALQERGDLPEAIASYDQALAFKPAYPGAHNNRAIALHEQGDLDAAIASYKRALELKPSFPEACNNLGAALQECGDLTEAIALYNQALALKSNYSEAHGNLANALHEQGDLDAAIASYKKALELKPHCAEAQSNLSMAELLIGDYKSGWVRYEYRLQKKAIHRIFDVVPRCTEWNGGNIGVADKLLLVSEQGLGDTLQFMRYVISLRSQGVNVSLCAPPQLHSLIQVSDIDPSPLTPQQANAVIKGFWIPLLSVPRHLDVSPDNPVIAKPYLKSSGELMSKWQRIFACEKRPIIGINWQGNPGHEKGHSQGRSLPLETFAPIAQNGNGSLLSLQKGFGSEQLETCSFKEHFVSCQKQVVETWDFLETAAIIANCDLVITSDTAVAHLAGGLGKTTWLLLKKVPEWRWGLEGDATFWYPSMRLFRQKERGNWDEVLRRVAETLQTEFLAGVADGHGLPTQESKQQSSEASAEQVCLEQQAIALLHQGRHQEAEIIYRDIISSGTRNHVIYAGLAAIYGEQGRFDEVVDLLHKALELNPDYPEAYERLGNIHKAQGNLEAAIASYGKALELRPSLPEAHNNLGNVFQAQGMLDAAIASYKKALELNGNFPEAHNNLGAALQGIGDLPAAIASYNKALELRPSYSKAHSNLANALQGYGDLGAAIASYKKALELNASFPEVHNSLAIALQEQGDLVAAIAFYKKALVLNDNFPEAHNNLGAALLERGELPAAIASFTKALEIRPGYPEARNNLGVALQGRGDLDAAIASYSKALELKPRFPQAQSNLSMTELLVGDYKIGWERYEYRFRGKAGQGMLNASPPCAEWNGGDLKGNDKLLLVSEQGLGDTLQFVRYALVLRQKGIQVSVCAPQKLHGLIRVSGIDPTPLTPGQANAVTEGRWIPMLSVPRHLEVSPGNPIITEPYIKTTGELMAKWREILAGEQRPIIGVNWQGNPGHEKTISQGRSLPLDSFAPIAQHADISLLSLQKGFGSEQLETCSFKERFVSCQKQVDETWDFLETAAIIANCDLVITSDTSVAHLAGGMGKATWLLLKKVPEWRWGLEGETTFWYPSMRLFRQNEWGNWDEVLQRVAAGLPKSYPVIAPVS